jgi:hypothetical protein
MNALDLALALLAIIAVSLAIECWVLVTAGPPALGDDLAGEAGGSFKQEALAVVHNGDKLSRGSAPRAANPQENLA